MMHDFPINRCLRSFELVCEDRRGGGGGGWGRRSRVSGAVEACGVVGGARLKQRQVSFIFFTLPRCDGQSPAGEPAPGGPAPRTPYLPSEPVFSCCIFLISSLILINTVKLRGGILAGRSSGRKKTEKNVHICIDYILITYKYICQ